MTQQKRKISLGWAILDKKAGVPKRTHGGSAKLYTSKGSANGALTLTLGTWNATRRDRYEVVEVFCEVSP